MATILHDPITRIEGHLAVEVQTDGSNIVTGVECQGTMFRGFELILRERDPRDATFLSQRICGV